MPLSSRQRLLELAEHYNVMILEDSPYFELNYNDEFIPSIKSLDKNERVIYAGSFSKIISPGIRLGFAVAPENIIQKMVVAKQVSDVHSNLYFQILIDRYMQQYDLDAHIAKCKMLYKSRRNTMHKALSNHLEGKLQWNLPKGGLFLWCRIIGGMDGTQFCVLAKNSKVMAVPGAAFLVDDTQKSDCIRLNFSLPSEDTIIEGINRLANIFGENFPG